MYKTVIQEGKQCDFHPSLSGQGDYALLATHHLLSEETSFLIILSFTASPRASSWFYIPLQDLYNKGPIQKTMVSPQNMSIQSQAVHPRSAEWQEKRYTMQTWTNKDQSLFTLWDLTCSLPGGTAIPSKCSCHLAALKRADFTMRDWNASYLLLFLQWEIC